MRKILLLVYFFTLISCKKDSFESIKPSAEKVVIHSEASQYVVKGIIKNLERVNETTYKYEISVWVATSSNPDTPLKLPGNLTINCRYEAAGATKNFTAVLKSGSTITKLGAVLPAPLTVTGISTAPSTYMGVPISFKETFTEILAPQNSLYPKLLFTAQDLPEIRSKVSTGWLNATFEKMKGQADKFLTINTNPYNPAKATLGRVINYQVNDLALTGYITNDMRYIQKAIEILCAAAQQYNAADFNTFNNHLAVGDAAHAYAIGYDWLYPYMTIAQRDLIKNEIDEFGTWIYNCSSTGSSCYGDYGLTNLSCNHNAVVHGALGLCALVLGDKPAWLDMAIGHVRGYLKYSIDDDGYSYEGLGYFGYGTLGAIPFSVALLKNGGPDLVAEEPRINKITNWILRYTQPSGGSLVTMNDSYPYIGSVGGFMHLITKYQDRLGLWTWLRLMGPKSGGGDGTYGIGHTANYYGDGSSTPYVILFADENLQPQSPIEGNTPHSYFFTSTSPNPGGRASFRSGWNDLDALVTFTCGYDRHRGHNHRDENSFTFYSHGEEFAIDPGYQPWETRSHNAILVDGIGQFRETNQYDVVGKTIAHRDDGNALYIKGDAQEAYLNIANVAIAKRQLLFVKGTQPYFIVADDIQKYTGTGEYKWLFHTTTNNQISITAANTAIITGNKRGAKCHIQFLWPQTGLQLSETNLTGQTFIARNITYNYSRFFKEIQATTTAINPRFVTFITASEGTGQSPNVSYTGTPDNMVITVNHTNGDIDRVTVTRDNITFNRN